MLTVDRTLYTDAADLLTQANQSLATTGSELFDALTAAAVSAGEGDAARSWCTSYEQAAGSVTTEVSQLVDAFGNVATLLDASGHNHAHAEAAAAPYGLPFDPVPRRNLARVSLSGIPSMYGGSDGEPWGWSLVAGHLAGFAWPGADIGRMRALAAAWHTAAGELQRATYLPSLASNELDAMASPELPTAIEVCERLGTACTALATDCDALGDACSAYVDAVEDARSEVMHAFKELLGAAGVGAGISIGAALLSGGLSTLIEDAFGDFLGGTVAATYLNRIIAALNALSDTLAALNPALAVNDAQGAQRGWLHAVASAAPVLAAVEADTSLLASDLNGMPQTGAPVGGATRYSVSAEDLEYWERTTKSHTIRKHVGRSYDDLMNRLAGKKRTFVSTFDDLDQAVAAINGVIGANPRNISAWLSRADRTLGLEDPLPKKLGMVVHRDGKAESGSSTFVFLIKDASQVHGFRVHTAYVNP